MRRCLLLIVCLLVTPWTNTCATTDSLRIEDFSSLVPFDGGSYEKIYRANGLVYKVLENRTIPYLIEDNCTDWTFASEPQDCPYVMRAEFAYSIEKEEPRKVPFDLVYAMKEASAGSLQSIFQKENGFGLSKSEFSKRILFQILQALV